MMVAIVIIIFNLKQFVNFIAYNSFKKWNRKSTGRHNDSYISIFCFHDIV